eukprot:16278445-Heterocapsa_arctica.AAC.1
MGQGRPFQAPPPRATSHVNPFTSAHSRDRTASPCLVADTYMPPSHKGAPFVHPRPPPPRPSVPAYVMNAQVPPPRP